MIMFKEKRVLIIIFLVLVAGCSTTPKSYSSQETKSLQAQAHKLSQDGLNERAVALAEQSIQHARKVDGITNELIEGYDDLGLFYFLLKDYQKSYYDQSIAVLLSSFHQPDSSLNNPYQQRLIWAYRKYKPEFEPASSSNPALGLVCQNMALFSENEDIQRFLFTREKALSPRRKYKLGRHQLISSVCKY